MKILILHSQVPAGAPPDELDTLVQVEAIASALRGRGHVVDTAAFESNPARLSEIVTGKEAELIFNLVESVWGRGEFAPFALQIMERMNLPVTGAGAEAMAATSDKLLAKSVLADAGLPTPKWSEGPEWRGFEKDMTWIVKSADEDASLGLDDDAVVADRAAVIARAEHCIAGHGGHWFAEEYVDGREFNVAILERNGQPEALPIAEMRFERWDESRPRIVGYAAKWDPNATEFNSTVRDFGWAVDEPGLSRALIRLAIECWNLFGCSGYARVDFRVDRAGNPYILEINANPCLDPEAGFAIAAGKAGLSYDGLVEHICLTALNRYTSEQRAAS